MGGFVMTAKGGNMSGGGANAPVDHFVYVAGGGNADSIERFKFDLATGCLTSLGRLGGEDPMYLAHRGGKTLYVARGDSAARAYDVSPGTGALTPKSSQPSGGALGVHVSVHPAGSWLFISNYDGGNVRVFPIKDNGDLGEASDTKSTQPNSHQIMPDPKGRFVFVPCRKGDNQKGRVFQFRFDAATGVLTPNSPASVISDDPRHIAFHPTGKWAYLVNEGIRENDQIVTPASVVVFRYDEATGLLSALNPPQQLPLLDGEGWGSHILVSPDGRYVFAGGRATNRIFAFRVDLETGGLTPAGDSNGGGAIAQPRGFEIDPTGRYLIVANESDGKVNVLEIGADGTLTKVGDTISSVAGARSVAVVAVPKP